MFTKQIYATLKLDEPGRFLKIYIFIYIFWMLVSVATKL